jgi:hypothetical protein
VQKIVRIRKEHFEGLLDPEEARDIFASPLVETCRIVVGRMQVEIRVTESRIFAPRVLEEHPDMFLAFARLGGNLEPRTDSIGRWVLKYGLPRSSGVHQGGFGNESYMFLEDFKEEARAAHRLLKLYAEIRGQDLAAIKSRVKNPQSALDEALRAAFNSTKHRTLLSVGVFDKDEVRLFTSFGVLTDAVNEKLSRLQRPQKALSASTVIETWYCPDLLTAMYLQLRLLIADRRPMRYCDFCGAPFPYRGNKFYCKSTCRSRARHQRNADAS